MGAELVNGGCGMGIDWDDIESAYAELQAARQTGGDTAVLMRLDEMKLCVGEAIDAHVQDLMTNTRASAWSWQRIADALGVTRQAASKRWSKRVFGR